MDNEMDNDQTTSDQGPIDLPDEPMSPPPSAIGYEQGPMSLPGPNLPIMRMAMLLGGILMAVAFFLPWWSVDLDPEKMKRWDNDDQFELAEIGLDNSDWYIDHFYGPAVGKRIFNEFKPFLRDQLDYQRRSAEYWSKQDGRRGRGDGDAPKRPEMPEEFSFSIWGSDTSTATYGLIGAVLIVVVVGAWRYLPGVGDRLWVVDLVIALIAVGVVISAIIWCIVCPGEDIGSGLKQGISVGPFLALAGGLLALVPAALSAKPHLEALRK